MRLKIISDGTAKGTWVVSLDGKPIEDITSVTWSISGNGESRATVELTNVPVELVGETAEDTQSLLTCPICDTRTLQSTKAFGRLSDHKGTNTMWLCGTCKKRSYAEDWFSTEGMN